MQIDVLRQRYEINMQVINRIENKAPTLFMNAVPVDRNGNYTAKLQDKFPCVYVERKDCSFSKAMDDLVKGLIEKQAPETIVTGDKINRVRKVLGCSMVEAKEALTRNMGSVEVSIKEVTDDEE